MPLSMTFDEARQRLIDSLKGRSPTPASNPRAKASPSDKPRKAAAAKASRSRKKSA